MKITLWPLEKITPYARNARKIPQSAVDKVAASIREFGWRQPIVVDREGVIICGHTRLLAAYKLGLREAPVHVAENLTPAQVRAYRLLDNRSHDEATWDDDLLGLELLDLKGMGVDLDLTGFDGREIDDLLANAELGDSVDAVPDLPANPITMPGELWLCGPHHRILCGDATSPEAVSRLLGGHQPLLMSTDPPYPGGARVLESPNRQRTHSGKPPWYLSTPFHGAYQYTEAQELKVGNGIAPFLVVVYDCPACIRLWRAYARATVAHVKVEGELEIADREHERVRISTVEKAGERRRAARQAIAEHEKNFHTEIAKATT